MEKSAVCVFVRLARAEKSDFWGLVRGAKGEKLAVCVFVRLARAEKSDF